MEDNVSWLPHSNDRFLNHMASVLSECGLICGAVYHPLCHHCYIPDDLPLHFFKTGSVTIWQLWPAPATWSLPHHSVSVSFDNIKCLSIGSYFVLCAPPVQPVCVKHCQRVKLCWPWSLLSIVLNTAIQPSYIVHKCKEIMRGKSNQRRLSKSHTSQ